MTGKATNKGPNDQPILEIDGLSKWFPINNAWKRRIGWLKALDDVSLTVRKGEIIGIVGESGCGKSTLGKTIMGIHPPTVEMAWISMSGMGVHGFESRPLQSVRMSTQTFHQLLVAVAAG